jgi:diguanylate cyclase (GGDEF)-like protein
MPETVTADPPSNLPGQSWLAQDAAARRATLTRIVVRISREALQGEGLHAMLQGICACIVAELPVAIASVILLNEENTHFVKEVYAGELTLSPLAIADTWPVSQGGAGRCARTGRTQLIADVDLDPDYVAGNSYVRSEYLVPIRHGQRMHGVLNIESTRTDFFDAESCAVFDAVSHLVAGAIHFARMADELRLANRKLERMSMSDGLTGIANRRCFDERLQADWSRLAGRNESLALLLVDADAFKPLNDASGHLYGDECLRELARVCESFSESEHDLVARFGGEELVLVLPGRSLEQARDVAERLRAAVEAVAMPHPDSPVAACVTISIGVSALVPHPAQAPEILVAMADRALYSAKLQGRNRVQVYAPGR